MKNILLLAVIALIGTAAHAQSTSGDAQNEAMNKQSNPSKTAASTAAPGIECDTCLKNTYQGPINKNTNPGYKGSNGSGSGNTETQGGTQ